MRFLTAFFLLLFGLTLNSPLVFAEDTTPAVKTLELPICQFEGSVPIDENIYSFETGIVKTKGDTASTYEIQMTEFKNVLSVSGTCGEINSASGYYEMRDCRKAGYTIAEVRENFAPDIGKPGDEKFIKTVHGGICCMGVEQDSQGNQECIDQITVYADTYEECTNKGNAFCSPRQWIVSKGGIGLLTLYLRQVFIFMTGFSGFIAVVVIIVSGIQIQYSGASGDISQYKDRIIRSLSGIVLLFVSSLILVAVNPDFFR